MQVVINISDSFYHRLIDMNIDNDTCSFNESALVEAIQNGTPLLKGHGRIIDESQVTGTFTFDNGYIECYAQTIIEADKEDN